MTDELDIYEALLRRSLERGVPTDAVADIFDLSQDVVKELAKECRITRFGTADQQEYLDNLQWETIERVMYLIRHGNAEQVARIATGVLGRQIAAAGKRPSSATEEQREELMAAFAGVREATARTVTPGRFVVGNTRTPRPAHGDDDSGD